MLTSSLESYFRYPYDTRAVAGGDNALYSIIRSLYDAEDFGAAAAAAASGGGDASGSSGVEKRVK